MKSLILGILGQIKIHCDSFKGVLLKKSAKITRFGGKYISVANFG
jgi:hypothetical protein